MNTQPSNLIARTLFPAALAVAVGAATWALRVGVDPSLVPLIVTVVSLLLVLVFERVLPRQGRVAERGENRTDLGFVVLSASLDPLVRAGLAGGVAALAAWLPAGLMTGLSPWTGALVVLLVAGLGDYWAHRFGHEWGWWWKLHAVHHAPHRMVALNNFRLHPLDLALKVAFAAIPVLLLGLSPQAIALAAAVKGVGIAFQHADIDLRHGWLNYVFATNSVHRWHHSAHAQEANANYGGVLSVFDLAFGSYHVPSEDLDPERMGLFDEKHYPVHAIVCSTVAPVCWRGCVEEP